MRTDRMGATLPDLDHGLAATPRLEGEALIAENINPATGLATDYLNHFNEITMLLGLLADMPEMIDEIRLWRPASYEEHFERSGFKGKALAIAAYRASPPNVRAALADTVAALDAALLGAIAELTAGPAECYATIVARADGMVRPLMARASGVIHGVDVDADLFMREEVQVNVDALLV
jgi:hypothetical protein